MIHNPVIDTMMKRRSVRKYTEQMPSDEVIETIVRAGQQAPFAAQLYSVLLDRKKRHPFKAPLQFTICVDMHKLELIMQRRGWPTASNNLSLLVFGFQDAAYAAENMVIAAESLGLGSCFIGMTPYYADRVKKAFQLPDRVFPLVDLIMGYPAEDFPPRPRYPLEYTLFEDRYPEMTTEQIESAMKVMDDGYLAQGYYKNQKIKIKIEDKNKQDAFSFADYSWTEHISRKWGQWLDDPSQLLKQLALCGFPLPTAPEDKEPEQD